MVMGAGAAVLFAPHAHRAAAIAPPLAVPKPASVSMPLFFEPNRGQTDPQVKFLARGSGYGIFLTADEAVLKLQSATRGSQASAPSVIRMRLEGANAGAVSGRDQLPGKSNYFIGNDPSRWHHGIPQFAQVEYTAVYPGINLVYYGNQGHLEYDFRVAPSADPNQIALSFEGAAARIDAGDLVLSTERGDVRFHAPRVYQEAGGARTEIAGAFRQIAEDKIGFSVGAYDRSRELVIDPVLSFSTYLGGSGAESSVSVAVGPDNNIYLAGSTMSSNFPVTSAAFQGTLAGTQNIFIAVINPNVQPAQLMYATYLGGSGIDTAAGVAVSSHIDQTTTGYDVYVAGSTTSPNFPTSTVLAPFQAGPQTGSHGFVSRLNIADNQLSYSTYLAGNGVDTVTGLAIDVKGDAFVTGTTTSTNSASGFPSTINAFQPCPWQPGVTCTVASGPTQFFASKINTAGTGAQSMLYSTFFGGGYPASAAVIGGGIAVDTSGNFYFTGGTNMPGVQGPNPTDYPFPLFNAQQSCLDEASKTVCAPGTPSAADAFVAKINPNIAGQAPVFSTYLGGSGDDVGYSVAVDGSGNVYVTGSTKSGDWVFPIAVAPVQLCLNNTSATTPCPTSTASDAFIAKIANPGAGGSIYPLIYFTYLGGSGDDVGQAIAVDTNQAAHVTGYTNSPNLIELNNLQGYKGSTDAFVGLVSTTISFGAGTGSGDYLTYLGGSQADQGTGIALDVNNATYVSGNTTSPDFPTANPLQPSLNGSGPDAFVTKLGASSSIGVSIPTDANNKHTSPSPNPVPAGNQVAFTFNITNNGPDTATTVVFVATIPSSGVTAQSAKITSGGTGSCGGVVGNTITCTINSLAVHPAGSTGLTGVGVVEVDLTPTLPVVNPQITGVTGQAGANGGPLGNPVAQDPANISDFSVSATPAQQTVTAGQNTSFNVTLSPVPTYTATVSMASSGLPAASTGTFTTTPVSLSGTSQATTTLNISTTPRPVTTGSLFRGHAFYATWLPVGGLSLLGLGVGTNRRRRRWLGLAVLGVLAGILFLQPGCGSSSPATTSGGTPAGTYTITITGSSGSVSHNTTVRLVVN